MLCLCISEATLSNAGRISYEDTCLFLLSDLSMHRPCCPPVQQNTFAQVVAVNFAQVIIRRKDFFRVISWIYPAIHRPVTDLNLFRSVSKSPGLHCCYSCVISRTYPGAATENSSFAHRIFMVRIQEF